MNNVLFTILLSRYPAGCINLVPSGILACPSVEGNGLTVAGTVTAFNRVSLNEELTPSTKLVQM